jgi:hypothetical protein
MSTPQGTPAPSIAMDNPNRQVGTSEMVDAAAPEGAASTSRKQLPRTPSLAPFRRGGKSLHRSRWAIKGDLIRALMALGEDAPTQDILRSLRGCGTARRKGPESAEGLGAKAMRRSGPDGKDQAGWTSGIQHCNRRLCPVCGLRIAVRRILKLQQQAKWVGAQYPLALHVTGALTCRHHDGNDPRQKFDALSALFDEWKKQDWVSGRRKGGKTLKDKVLLGYFMTAEDTYGANGHHAHLQFGASLDVPADLDPEGRKGFFEAFRKRSREWFEENAPRFGITCEWKEDWMDTSKSSVDAVVRYVVKGEKEKALSDLMGRELNRKEALTKLRLEKEAAVAAISGDVDRLTREATLGQLKLDRTGTSFFDMPVIEQVRLWNATKGMRWFRVGGIWRTAETEKSDETLAEEDETAGEEIAAIAPEVWANLASEVWHILSAVNEDVRYPREVVKAVWEAAQAMALQGLDQRTIRDTLVSMIPGIPPS